MKLTAMIAWRKADRLVGERKANSAKLMHGIHILFGQNHGEDPRKSEIKTPTMIATIEVVSPNILEFHDLPHLMAPAILPCLSI